MREELTLLRIEGAQSRLPVDWTKNAVKFNTSKKSFWECEMASRSQKRKKIRAWGRMGEHHELFITKFEGDLALRSPKLEKNGPKLANQAS